MDLSYLIKQEARRRGLSERTIEIYCFCVANFFKRVNKEPKKVTKDDIKMFVDYLLSKNAAGSTINVYVNALKFLLEEILAKRILWKIKYSKTPKSLPVFLTKDEVKQLIGSINNTKHRLMIELMYSAGLRISELLHLKVVDLDLENNIGWIRNGKGKKDRLFIVSQKIKDKLKEYITEDIIYLFEGKKGMPLHSRTLQEIIKKATKKAGIKKNVHPHTLRHSFATHLIENGYDVASVQSLLGHSSSKTTMIYIHMGSPNLINVKSPYDSIF